MLTSLAEPLVEGRPPSAMAPPWPLAGDVDGLGPRLPIITAVHDHRVLRLAHRGGAFRGQHYHLCGVASHYFRILIKGDAPGCECQ